MNKVAGLSYVTSPLSEYIGSHISNIFKSGELSEASCVAFFATELNKYDEDKNIVDIDEENENTYSFYFDEYGVFHDPSED